MYRCVEFSSILLCWEEAPLFSCRCFTGCRLKGRDKSNFLPCHVSDITSLFIFSYCLFFTISMYHSCSHWASHFLHLLNFIDLHCFTFTRPSLLYIHNHLNPGLHSETLKQTHLLKRIQKKKKITKVLHSSYTCNPLKPSLFFSFTETITVSLHFTISPHSVITILASPVSTIYLVPKVYHLDSTFILTPIHRHTL